jgi:hypothetical protein
MKQLHIETFFDPTNLEKLLIKDWTEYIDIRKLINFLSANVESSLQISNPKIQTIIVSNCIFNNKGLFVWVDYKIIDSDKLVNATSEILLKPDSSIELIRTI